LLEAVADADGSSSIVDRHEIPEIAAEPGIDPAEVFDRE
jgi:hypothetical protein